MVKIETTVRVSQEFPAGKSGEYIWIEGQPWPVSEEEEQSVISVEVFGDELTNPVLTAIGHSEDLKTAGRVTCRTWRQEKARYVSAQMRAVYV